MCSVFVIKWVTACVCRMALLWGVTCVLHGRDYKTVSRSWLQHSHLREKDTASQRGRDRLRYFREGIFAMWGQTGRDSKRENDRLRLSEGGEMILMEETGTQLRPPENCRSLVKIPLEEMKSFYRFIVSCDELICKFLLCHVLRWEYEKCLCGTLLFSPALLLWCMMLLVVIMGCF